MRQLKNRMFSRIPARCCEPCRGPAARGSRKGATSASPALRRVRVLPQVSSPALSLALLPLFWASFLLGPVHAENSLDLTDIPLSPTVSQKAHEENKKQIELLTVQIQRLEKQLAAERRKSDEAAKQGEIWKKKHRQLATELEQLKKSNEVLRTLTGHHADERREWRERSEQYNDSLQKISEQLGKCDESLSGAQGKLEQCGAALQDEQKHLSECRATRQAASATAGSGGANNKPGVSQASSGANNKPGVSQASSGANNAAPTFTEPFTGMDFVLVSGGCYRIGCGDWAADCDDDEKPAREVCLDSFWLGKYEVTQKQWIRVMGNNPSGHKNGPDYPVERVSWHDAMAFAEKMSATAGQKFHLPSEAQWEYAARGRGRENKYAGGRNIEVLAHYSGNSSYSTHKVGIKRGNELGIYDMSGNVWEWCGDWYLADYYATGPRDNPAGPASGVFRVRRGGGFDDPARFVRVTFRGRESPADRYDYLGFRLAAPATAFAQRR